MPKPSNFDLYDEFQPPPPPIEGGVSDSRYRRRQEESPREEGRRYGRGWVSLTDEVLKTQMSKWEGVLKRKLALINSEIKELEMRTGSFLLILTLIFGILIGLAGFFAALIIDYVILEEFWTRTFMDEFGQVPPTLVNSTIVKSGQVVIAALMFHFFYVYLSRRQKKWFAGGIFFLVVVLLLGTGILTATNSIPPGTTIFGVEVKPALAQRDTTLSDLGLASAPPPAAAVGGAGASQDFATFIGLVWYATFAGIFIAVTGVAVLSLSVARRAAAGLFGTIDREHYDGRSLNRQDMIYRLERAKDTRKHLRNPDLRRTDLGDYLNEFLKGYLEGIGDLARKAAGERNTEKREKLEELLNKFETAHERAFQYADPTFWYWDEEDEDGSGRSSSSSSSARSNGAAKRGNGHDPDFIPDKLPPAEGDHSGKSLH